MKAYKELIETVLQNLSTDSAKGLSFDQVIQLQKRFGKNILPKIQRDSLLKIFFRQFQNPLIYILLVAATIIFFVGDPLDAFVISGVLFFNAVIGTIQEGRTERMLESLRKYLKFQVIVLRDGKKKIVQSSELVPGDIVILQEGEKVPADARLLEAHHLLVDESMLTGESRGIAKEIKPITQEVSIADQKNMIFKGTYILNGFAKAVVVATADKTEIGRIGHAIEEIETEMPLKREIDHLSGYILYFILLVCLFLLLIGVWQGRTFVDMLVILTALFICVIPEGLPVIMTLTLVTGAYRMSKENVLVKRLQAAEGLGRTDVIIIDKTGTLTRNEMIVSKLYADDKLYEISGQGYKPEGNIYYEQKPLKEYSSTMHLMGLGCSLMNKTEIEFVPDLKLYNIKGDPTEAALFVFSQKIDISSQEALFEYKPLYEQPFESVLRYQAGIYQKGDDIFCFIAGAPETIINKCHNAKYQTQQTLQELVQEGFRVIGMAEKKIDILKLAPNWQEDSNFLKQLFEDNFNFLGLFAIEDTIRPEVKRIVAQAKSAGLNVVMATGDHRDTALFVARKVGIFHDGDRVIEGKEIDLLSDDELSSKLDLIKVFARVSPENKLRIVQLFRKKGNIVAMTGDGVNDAPSLVAADLGIAMGAIGTEVAKRAADMILLDDSFMSVVHAIEQGRHIFATLRRVITYFFTTNMAEIFIILFALVANMPLPLLAVQILWLNLITDGFLDVALSLEPCHEKALAISIHVKKITRLVDWKVFLNMVYLSIPMALGSLFIFNRYYEQNISLARTMALVTMAMYQWFNAWNCRSEKFSIFKIGILSNYWLLIATFFVLGLQMILLYTIPGQYIFKTVPLTFNQWCLILLLTAPLFIFEELRKVLVNYLFKD
jgi:Ca2+-transporting ATPase